MPNREPLYPHIPPSKKQELKMMSEALIRKGVSPLEAMNLYERALQGDKEAEARLRRESIGEPGMLPFPKGPRINKAVLESSRAAEEIYNSFLEIEEIVRELGIPISWMWEKGVPREEQHIMARFENDIWALKDTLDAFEKLI